MRLRTLAQILVAAALAGPAGAAPPEPAPAPAPAPALDVAPVHTDAAWRYVPVGDVFAAVMPLGPDDRAIRVRALDWATVAGACDGSCVVTGMQATTAVAMFSKTGAPREYKLGDLRAIRDRYAAGASAGDPMLRAWDFVVREKLATRGVWLSAKGATKDEIPAELVRGDVPAIDARRVAVIAGVYDQAVKGGTLETLIAALPDSADRAAFRALARFGGDPRVMQDVAVAVTPLGAGWLVRAHAGPPMGGCTGGQEDGHLVAVVLGTEVEVLDLAEPVHGHCRGRRPPGFTPPRDASPARGELARFHAASAHLEAASVAAFELLAAELAALAAPPALVARARAAADDERRHAQLACARAGTRVAPARYESGAPRAAFALALDNAVEGCVHEAFAALVASFQAARLAAHDPELAAELAAIADDELEHGQLAWDVAAWLEPRLPAAERAAITAARSRALADLAAHADAAATGGLARELATRDALGLPSAAQATALARGLAGYSPNFDDANTVSSS